MPRSRSVEFDATVCGGFPVTVMAEICGPERDVGLNSSYIDEICVLTRTGKPAKFIVAKMKESDWRELEELALEA